MPNDHYFIHKGVVAWDRKTVKPHYPEMKKAFQWISTDLTDAISGAIRIKNKFQFISLEGFEGVWSLTEKGVEISKGTFAIPRVGPLREGRAFIPYKIDSPKPGAEYFLRVSYTQKNKTLWAGNGYEVAWDQFKLPINTEAIVEAKVTQPVTLIQTPQLIKIAGSGFTVTFDKKTGLMSHLQKGNVDMLVADGGPKLHLWRAAHRNDDMWVYGMWEKYGVNNLQYTLVDIQAQAVDKSNTKVVSTVKGQGKEGFSVYHTATYLVQGNGVIKVDNDLQFVGLRINLGRIGVRMLLNKSLDQMQYFGRGPYENYNDRKSSADVGIYELGVNEQYEYEKPMERGNHEEVRWAKLMGNNMPQLMVKADANGMQIAALPHTDEQMHPVEYKIDLPKSTATVFACPQKPWVWVQPVAAPAR